MKRLHLAAIVIVLSLLVLRAPSFADEARPYNEAAREGGRLKYVENTPVLMLQGTPEEIGKQEAALHITMAAGDVWAPA